VYATNSAAQVSTILKVALMPARSRAARISASVLPQSSAILLSAKPICLARLSTSGSSSPAAMISRSNSTISRMFSRNHGSMAERPWICWVVIPRR